MLLSEALEPSKIRHESALTSATASVGSAAELDAVIQERIDKRASYVGTIAQVAAGSYPWPYNLSTMAKLYPTQGEDDHQASIDEQWEMAVDAVRCFVLCDLFMRVSERNPQYVDKAKLYCTQGKEMLVALKGSIESSAGGGGSTPEYGGGDLSLLTIKLPSGRRRSGEYDDYGHGCCGC